MKKGQTGEGIIEKIDFPNKGIIYTEDGERVIVKNGLPGQKVRFAVHKKRKGKCEGQLLEVLEKSPIELEQPACIHFGNCGGCTYQNLGYEDQLKLKEGQVRELLSAVFQSDPQASAGDQLAEGTAGAASAGDRLAESAAGRLQDGLEWFEGIKPSPRQFAYRNKMEFSFGDEYKDGPLALGMHKRGSFYDIVAVNQCRIADTDFNRILDAALSYFLKEGTSYFQKKSHEGYLRHLLVRKAEKTGEILIDLVTTTQNCGSRPQQDLLHDFKETMLGLELCGNIKGILHTKNDSIADVVKDEGTEILYGKDYFYEELLGLKFKISTFSFFQTNSLGAEVLYETVREFIASSGQRRAGTVYDLYSGTGTIAQMLAPSAEKVIGVEIVEEAVKAAEENAAANGLSNCTFIAGDVLKVLDQIEEKPDFIVLDPPREGIHPRALEKILKYGVERMIYISCKPTSLVRDLAVMRAGGYEVVRGCCVDMFPGTVHTECVVGIQRKHI